MNSMSRRQAQRRGVIVPMVALGLIGLLGCVALAIDIGMMATARTQSQAAADAAAMAGARTLNGDVANNNNEASVLPTAQAAATGSSILGTPITPGMVTIESGSYTYNESLQKFEITIPKHPDDNFNLVRVNVQSQHEAAFGKVLGMNFFNVHTSAVGAHRPRDVAVILDHSGSMRFDSLLGIPYTGNRTMSNNSEDVFPRFGAYSDIPAAALQNTNSYTTMGSQVYGSANITVTTDSGEALVGDFYSHPRGGAATKAFAPPDVTLPPDTYENTPGGDNCPFQHNSTTNYAQTIQQIIESSANAGTSADGWKGYTQPPYDGYAGPTLPEFSGYTHGPRYWGKTFWIWPPDPRPSNDWRQKFFGTNDNTRLYDNGGNWRSPSAGGYTVNYSAILDWIKNTGPNPFPTRLRAGRILYYDAIPSSISGSFPSDQNERFWKEYIDYVLGLEQTGGTNYNVVTARSGYGNDFAWGTIRITAPNGANGQINNSAGYPIGYTGTIATDTWSGSTPSIGHRIEMPTGSGNWYTVTTGGSNLRVDRPLAAALANNNGIRLSSAIMPYFDNPRRPKLHFWFGPMTLIDFLGNYNDNRFLWPGTCHEAPLYTQKLGIRASLKDMENNHPNDSVCMMMFSTPKYSAGGAGQFNRTRGPLGRKYRRLTDALFFPPDTIADDFGGSTADISCFDAVANDEVPRSKGGTTPVMGFMLAFNQFSTNPILKTWAPPPAPDGEAGGLGRIGAQKLVIFLTDGVANTAASASFTNAGPNRSYYRIRQPGEFPSNSGTVTTQLYNVVDQLVADETDSPPGYSTRRRPVIIHSLAFGTLFEPTTSSPDKNLALGILQNVAYRGNTLASAGTPLPDENRIIGNSAERVARLQAAFKRIMQDGKQVLLLE
ncbi:MAG: pilus assembly protein TadG-related protein [Gemmataceae bacterium]